MEVTQVIQEKTSKTIQRWWRKQLNDRCNRCGDLIKGFRMCWSCYEERCNDVIPEEYWEGEEEREQDRKRKSQEKKRALGLIP